MTTKTVEKVTHSVTPKGLPLYIKWTEGRELLRNSRSKAGKEGWEPATTLGTRVVWDTEWEEHAVYVYINERRYYPADYHCDDKSEALEMAKSLREFNSFGVKPKVKATSKRSKAKAKAKPKATTSPKGKKTRKPRKATSSPKGKEVRYFMEVGGKTTEWKPPVARRARHQKGRQPTLTGLTFTIGADNQVIWVN